MDGLTSEKEQLEALRTWWQENGLYIGAGVVLTIALLVGWSYWKQQNEQSAAAASALYESLVSDVAEVQVEPAEAKAAEMQTEYGDTVYAEQARLAMAKLYMSVGRDQDAAEQLRALLAAEGSEPLRMIGRLRLARILLYQERPQEVVDLLAGHGDTAFAARYAETLGDAYTALGRFDEAREAYTAALAGDPQAPTVDVALVRMKINDLPPPAEPATAAAAGTPADAGAESEPAEDAAGDEPADDEPAGDEEAEQ